MCCCFWLWRFRRRGISHPPSVVTSGNDFLGFRLLRSVLRPDRPDCNTRAAIGTMKMAMLLVSLHFLATAVEARPRVGSRQLGKQKKIPNATATVGSARLPTVTANRAPGERQNTTTKWLFHARPGVCAPTEITQGNCHTGAKGAWALRREQSTDWHTTVNHCLRLCSSCPRCGYISVHAAEPAECNWFV